MGIIKKQSISGTIYSYLGVAVGFITTGLVYPSVLSKVEVGLFTLLISVSAIFAQFSGLGFNAVMLRNFPYFRDKENGHHGFLTLALVVNAIGLILAFLTFFIIKPWLIAENVEKSALFVDYIMYLIPLIFFTSFFNLLDNYFRSIYNSIKGIEIKELWQRVFVLLGVLGYFIGIYDFGTLVIMFTIAISLPSLLILYSVWRQGELHFGWDKGYIKPKMFREMASVSLYGIATSFSGVLIMQVDKIFVNHYLGLGDTGIYAIAFYFGTLVLIPSRPLIKIASVLIADGWKSNDHAKIDEIYKKSNIVLTIVALLMFFGLWINIDHVFKIIGEEYIAGKYVILLVGLANVFEMSTSVSQYIINNSAYYKVITWFLLLFVVLLIISNAILIPLYGITGCAIAAVISRFVYNFLSWLFLYRKFGFQPFNLKYILLIFISLISFGLAWIIPQFSNFIIDMIVRSSVFVLFFGSGVLLSKLSPDLNDTFTGSLRKLKIIK